MKFAPKTDKEIAEMNLWQPGEYGFEILSDASLGPNHYATVDRTSKNGNDMIQLVVRVYNADGQFRVIVDYLLESMPSKLRHAALACGLKSQYEGGSLEASQFIGKTGNLKLKIQKDKTGEYADKNAISDYVVAEGNVDAFVPPKGHPVNDPAPIADDLPW